MMGLILYILFKRVIEKINLGELTSKSRVYKKAEVVSNEEV